MEWKCKKSWSTERMACLNRCMHLLQNNKVVNGFKGLGLFELKYAELRNKLNEQINKERDSLKE